MSTDPFKNHVAKAGVSALTTMWVRDEDGVPTPSGPTCVAQCTGMIGGNFGTRVHDFWEGTRTQDWDLAQKEADEHNKENHG